MHFCMALMGLVNSVKARMDLAYFVPELKGPYNETIYRYWATWANDRNMPNAPIDHSKTLIVVFCTTSQHLS